MFRFENDLNANIYSICFVSATQEDELAKLYEILETQRDEIGRLNDMLDGISLPGGVSLGKLVVIMRKDHNII